MCFADMSQSTPHILLVEDEPNLGSLLRDYLEMNGLTVTWCADGDAGLMALQQQSVDAVILDVMMPKRDGFEVAKDLRRLYPTLPLMFLTARGQREDRIHGLKLGADDYLVKPFDAEELLLRVKVLLRRNQPQATPVPVEQTVNIGRYVADFQVRQLTFSGLEPVRLSPREAELLALLLRFRNDLLPRDLALNTLWGDDSYFNGRSMDVFVSRLRTHFRHDAAIKIENVHSKGYRLVVG